MFSEKTIAGRIQRIQPHEYIIFFILAILLALCLAVAQIVIQDVDAPDGRPGPSVFVPQR